MGLFGKLLGSKETQNLDWKNLSSTSDVDQMLSESKNQTCIVFKHSTRCSISSMALRRFESGWDQTSEQSLYFLDLIQFRDVSNYIADKLNVTHQSPQVIVIRDGVVIYHNSHNAIDPKIISEQ